MNLAWTGNLDPRFNLDW
ncbi:hypothetical protein F383_22023 [Gossypium arboreum]|uniref:Uncharacterized protein n=1 Tax=Gossypium arboreum TaxID=29729 RepID=A0A0B0NXW5_GOSAR|nr:hypothetical protein F383_22023 [Gossypium arboreum]